jgi:crotonobetainyl-CoA:carnitine CoA-transferase CaiB-like acyl-CoA transferase
MLTGYRVLDITDEKSLLCPKLLSDMGGEVIRIEKPGRGAGEIQKDHRNTGKRFISLDIETGKGKELFKRLIKTSDIFMESFPPGDLASLGLDYTALCPINPRLIMASITPFGQTGPYKDNKSSDIISSALGGQMYVCGDQDKPPLKPFGPQAFATTSLFATNGILLALWHRHISDRGQHLDIDPRMRGC